MKKEYEKPTLEVTEFRFTEHIAASSGCTSIFNNRQGCDWVSSTN